MSPEARERSFDELTRGLASGSISRGRALRLMGADLVGGALGSLGGVAAAAPKCKQPGKHCHRNEQCCSNNCSNRICQEQASCPSGQVELTNGTCATPCDIFSSTDCSTCNTTCSSDISGALYCFNVPEAAPGCQSDSDCPVGTACAQTTLTSGECFPVCNG
jgi:hypothetical protein